MKKHFLLLLWMTLLPLAGWAETNYITIQLAQLQFVYGDDEIPENGTEATEAMIAPISNLPVGVTPGLIAQAFTFSCDPITGVDTYSYGLTRKSNYQEIHGLEDCVINISGGNGQLKVLKRPITIQANNASKTYGDADPELTASITSGNMVGTETLNYTVTRAEGFTPNTYSINVNVTEDEVSANYDITTVDGTFTINAKELAQNDLTIDDIPSVPFNASYWKPELNIKYGEVALEKGTDYTVAYTNNSNPGTATATVTLQGNYQNDGVIKKDFTITKYDLSNDADYASKIQVTGYSGLVYDGKAKTPAVTVKLNGVTYANAYVSRSWENNINATTENSKATLTLTGAAGAFKGTKKIEVEIAPKPLEEVNVSVIDDQDFTGSALIPNANLSFRNGDDVIELDAELYTVKGTNNINVGEATLTFTAKEGTNYTGSTTQTFNIKPVTVYIKPFDQSKFYGQADPNFAQPTTAMYELVDGEGHAVEGAVLNGTVALGRKAGETVGDYAIYVKSYTEKEGVKDNYSPSNTYYENDLNLGSHTATFTIKTQEAKLILKFKEGTVATKVYGDPTPTYTKNDLEVVSGLAGSDTWESLKDYATFTPTLESEDVHYDGNKVTATITLTNYPNIEVQPLPFTVTKRPLGIIVSAQTINYGGAINPSRNGWSRASASSYAPGEGKINALVELYTDEDVATFAPRSVNEGVIKARIADESNYELDEDNSVWGTLTINAANLELKSDADDFTKIKAFKDLNVNVSIDFTARNGRELPKGTTRKWKGGEWNTLTLPFDITVAELSQILGYAIVNEIDPTGYSESSGAPVYKFKLTMKGAYGKDYLPANKPFAIKTADDINDINGGVIDFGEQTIKAPTEDDLKGVDAGGGSKFKPAYAEKPVSSADNGKIWFLLGNHTKWAYITPSSSNTWTILPLESYIDQNLNPASASNAIFMMEDLDGTTAIHGINVDDAENAKLNSAKGWYNLNGVKMENAPAMKGVYIKDGKKVVIK